MKVIELACLDHPERTYREGLSEIEGWVECPDCGHGENVRERTQVYEGWGPLLTTEWSE